MHVPCDLKEFEKKLAASFKDYNQLGKYHYTPELKKKVFDAYSRNIKPERIVELCDISISTATNWFHIFRVRSSCSDNSTQSQFREIKISTPIVEEKIDFSAQETPSLIQEKRTETLKIKFPNGIKIKYKTTEVNKIIQDLFFIKN